MKELMESPYFGVALSVIAFWFGEKLQRKLKTPICNPLIIAIVLIVGILFNYTSSVQKVATEQCFSILDDSREQLSQMSGQFPSLP